MRPDIRRLKTRREFLRVAAARRKRVRPGLIVQAARRNTSSPRPAAQPPRSGPDAEAACAAIGLGFTASRKVGKAVERNRAKRRLRAAAAQVLPDLGEAGTDYVLVARKATLARPFGDLLKDLHEALMDIGYQGPDRGRAPRQRRQAAGGRPARGRRERR